MAFSFKELNFSVPLQQWWRKLLRNVKDSIDSDTGEENIGKNVPRDEKTVREAFSLFLSYGKCFEFLLSIISLPIELLAAWVYHTGKYIVASVYTTIRLFLHSLIASVAFIVIGFFNGLIEGGQKLWDWLKQSFNYLKTIGDGFGLFILVLGFPFIALAGFCVGFVEGFDVRAFDFIKWIMPTREMFREGWSILVMCFYGITYNFSDGFLGLIENILEFAWAAVVIPLRFVFVSCLANFLSWVSDTCEPSFEYSKVNLGAQRRDSEISLQRTQDAVDNHETHPEVSTNRGNDIAPDLEEPSSSHVYV